MLSIQKNGSGFSIVELLIVIVVIGIIGLVGFRLFHHSTTPTQTITQATASNSGNAASTPPSTNGTDTTKAIQYIYQGGGCAPATIDSYPSNLCSAPLNSIRDALGYENRECGSYLAFMESSTGHDMPYHISRDVGDWPANVPAAWIVSTPSVGDAAIRPRFPGVHLENGEVDPGHAMYIVGVNYEGSGNLLVKQYNQDLKGDFSEAVVAPSGTFHGNPYHLVYIQFPLTTG